MRDTFVWVALVMAMIVPASAQTFQAINRLQVVPLNQSDFEVIEARGEGARGIWCAAADYALARFGNTGQQRMYIKSPRGPSVSSAGRKGVVFTMDASSLAVAPSRSLSVTVRTVGVGLTLNHAVQFCRDNLIEPDDILLRLGGN